MQPLVLWAPKEGNTDEQYEDACAHTPPESTGERFTVALSDGASSALFAREWANLLVNAFADGFPASDDEARAQITALGRDWHARVSEKATSWYAQERLPGGSSATLLVVTWDESTRTWDAAAIGDVCVFLVRKNVLRYAFPLIKSAEFDDRPSLATTEPTAVPYTITRYKEAYEPGDFFVLATDALAAYFLAEYEARRTPWNEVPRDQAALAPWLKARRDARKLKNDDVTFVEVVL